MSRKSILANLLQVLPTLESHQAAIQVHRDYSTVSTLPQSQSNEEVEGDREEVELVLKDIVEGLGLGRLSYASSGGVGEKT